MSNGNVMVIRLIAGLKKRFSVILLITIPLYVLKTLVALQRIKMSQYFPKHYEPFGGDINVKVDLSNYAQKQILKIFRMLILQVLH